MKDTQDKIGCYPLSLELLYEDSTEYDNNGEVYLYQNKRYHI